jgi:hypothetical protein
MNSIIWVHAMAINDIPDKLARVRTIDQRCVLHGAGVHRYQLNPCLSPAAIQRFELEHGVELPVLTAWNAPTVSKDTVRSICSGCGYSIDQIS